MPPTNLTSLPLAAAISITPAPTPTQYGVTVLDNDGRKVVVLQVATAQGVQFFFMSTDVAGQLSDDLKKNAGSGIVIVPAGAMPR